MIDVSTLRLFAAVLIVSVSAVAHASASSAYNEAAAAEELVGAVYYEGLPYDPARAITAAGAAHLTTLLDDPSRVRSHANVLLALGICAHPGAYEAISGYAQRGSSGEIDGPSYRARRVLVLAMGHLASADDRALVWLEGRARAPSTDPGWSRGAMRGVRLAEAQRTAAIQALGVAARPEADAILNDLLHDTTRDPQIASQATEALALARRIRADGPSAVLSPEAIRGR